MSLFAQSKMPRREHRGTPAQSAWADMEAGTHVCPQRVSGSEETQVRRAWEPDAGTAGGSGVQPASRSSGVRPPCLVPRQGQHPRGGGAAPTAGSRRGLTEVLQPPPPGRAGPGRAGHRLPPSSSTPPACPISPPLPVPAARLGEGGGTHPGSCCPAGPLRLRLPGSAWGFPRVLRPGDSPRTDASASPSVCRACGFQVPFPGGNPAPGRGFRFALAAGGLGAPGRGSAAAARRSPRACPLASAPGLGPALRVCPIAVAPGGVVWNTVGTPAEPRAPSPPVPDARPCPPKTALALPPPRVAPTLPSFTQRTLGPGGGAAVPPHTAPDSDANPSDCPVSWSPSLASEVLGQLLSVLQTAGRGRPAEPCPPGPAPPATLGQHAAETGLAAGRRRPASLPLAAASWLLSPPFL